MVCCLNLSKMNFEIRQKENDLRNWAWCRRPRPRNYCCCCCWLMSCKAGPNSGTAKGHGILGQFELRFVISPVIKIIIWKVIIRFKKGFNLQINLSKYIWHIAYLDGQKWDFALAGSTGSNLVGSGELPIAMQNVPHYLRIFTNSFICKNG